MRIEIKILALFLTLSVLGWVAFQSGGTASQSLTAASNLAAASNSGPKWKEWDAAYAAAQKDKKIVLVDLYTDWCGWCKVMDKETYAKANVIEEIEKNFVPVKLNPELQKTYSYEGKSYTGRELQQRLNSLGAGGFKGYPTTVFVVPQNGEDVVMIVSGYLQADQFVEVLKQMVTHAETLSKNN